jgi:hypothetical protein
MEQCIVLSARRYDFKDEAGKQVQGVNLTYLTDDVQDDPDARGLAPMNVTAPYDLWPQLGVVPGVYDLDFKQRPGPKGKPTLQLVRVKFVGEADFLKVVENALSE